MRFDEYTSTIVPTQYTHYISNINDRNSLKYIPIFAIRICKNGPICAITSEEDIPILSCNALYDCVNGIVSHQGNIYTYDEAVRAGLLGGV